MVKVCEDGLAGKVKPPVADEKEKVGYGPAVEKKCSYSPSVGIRRAGDKPETQPSGENGSVSAPLSHRHSPTLRTLMPRCLG